MGRENGGAMMSGYFHPLRRHCAVRPQPPERGPDATHNRPNDRTSFQREARRLAATGLTPRDIAGALKLGIAATECLLRDKP